MLKSTLKENNSILRHLIISLIGVAVFNLLPSISEKTANFSYVFVFAFTAYFWLKIITSKVKFNTQLTGNFFYLFLIFWTLVIILRAGTLNYDFFRSIFLSPYVLLPYLFPFVARYFTIYDFRKILVLLQYCCLAFLLFVLLFFLITPGDFRKSLGFVEDLNKYLAFPVIFGLLSFKQLNKNQKFIFLAVFFIGFLIAIYTARRSLSWTFSWALLFFIYANYNEAKVSVVRKIKFYLIILSVAVGFYILYQKYEESLFGNLIEKINADTRGTVLSDFEKDMKIEDWIFGKGIGGEYKLLDTDLKITNDLKTTRNIIEAGYLNLVLKGGYIYLILLGIIYFTAIYRGLFVSKNNLGKAFALFIMIHVVELYPAGIITFNIRFLLIWFAISMLWNKKFLNMNDELLYKELNRKIA